MGLEEAVEPHTFQSIQSAKPAGKGFEIEGIARALSEDDDRIKFPKESAKVLAANFGK